MSRTCTAPFDRLKIFLITRPPELGGTSLNAQAPVRGFKAIVNAIGRIYAEGGVLAFWTGNGLSVVKILPESAIKFLSYESSVSHSYRTPLFLQLASCLETHVCKILGQGGRPPRYQRREPVPVWWYWWNH